MRRIRIFLAMALLLSAFTGCSAKGNSSSAELSAESSAEPSQVSSERTNPYNILNYQPQSSYQITVQDMQSSIQPGKTTDIKGYSTAANYPGGMVIVDKNTNLSFNVTNHLKDATTIHWHGLDIPNDQDGPGVMLNPGESKSFHFRVEEAGTYWYHPHMRPILPQLNSGLYAPFIVKEEYDSQYAGDYVMILDDWTLSPDGKIDNAFTTGDMEIMGNVETVNGKTGDDIDPVTVKKGEIVKLRLINASTAQYHTLKLNGQQMRVTHLDGYGLPEPYTTDSVTLAPGERIDVEIKGARESGTDYLNNERNFGMRIPIIYEGAGVDMDSPFVPPASRAFQEIEEKPIDFEYVLNSRMKEDRAQNPDHGAIGQDASQSSGMAGMGQDASQSSGMPGMGHSAAQSADEGGMKMNPDDMEWTINGKAFPDMDVNTLKVGQVYKIRFINNDTEMMHAMAHPIHIHGEHFQILSVNGKKPDREILKDTISVNPGEYADIAIRFDHPGDWMLHCHIIDHEDNGMLTLIKAE